MCGTQTSTDVAFVGLGGWGTQRADNVRSLGHTVVAGVDTVRESREKFATTFDADTYEHYEELPYDELDAVVIGTPNKFHAEAAITALESGVYTYVAKPMARDVKDAESMLDAERESEAFGMVGFNSRFSTAATFCKAYAREGWFGEFTHVETYTLRRRGIPGVGSWFTDLELAGGGALIDIGVHAIDRTLYFLDFPDVLDVVGTTRSNFGGEDDYVDPDRWSQHWDTSAHSFEVDDSASAFVRFVDGASYSLEVAWADNRTDEYRTIVRGTKAGATMDVEGPPLVLHDTRRTGTDHYFDVDVTGDVERTGHEAALHLFFEAVTSNEKPEHCTFEEAIVSQRIIEAIYESSETDRPVRFD